MLIRGVNDVSIRQLMAACSQARKNLSKPNPNLGGEDLRYQAEKSACELLLPGFVIELFPDDHPPAAVNA